MGPLRRGPLQGSGRAPRIVARVWGTRLHSGSLWGGVPVSLHPPLLFSERPREQGDFPGELCPRPPGPGLLLVEKPLTATSLTAQDFRCGRG